MTQKTQLNVRAAKPRENLTTGLLVGFSALWLFLGTLASISGVEHYELSSSSESWKYVEDQLRGTRYSCLGSGPSSCGLWLYLDFHEEPLFYQRQRENFMRLKNSPLRGKSVQVWYACPWMGRCEPGELVVEGLDTIVTLEQTERDLRTTTFFRFLLATVTLIPGIIFSVVVYRRLVYPSPTTHQRDIPTKEKQIE